MRLEIHRCEDITHSLLILYAYDNTAQNLFTHAPSLRLAKKSIAVRVGPSDFRTFANSESCGTIICLERFPTTWSKAYTRTLLPRRCFVHTPLDVVPRGRNRFN